MDIASIVLLSLAEILYAYRFVVSAINTVQFPPGDVETINKIQFKGLDYYERAGSDSIGLIFYWVNLIAGPGKAGLVADLMAGITMGFAQNWGFLSFFVLMLIPSAGIEIGLFSSEPFMSFPSIAWAKLFGIESDEIYEDPRQTQTTFNDGSQFY